ncbi:large membrane protein [Streptomyces sp. NRRL F-6491]|nr:large membrane protein [Streptomyces sp. NRRL F-6491]KOX50682.1 large membrane protein [Streptomyces sp. NRRL F-6492]
MLTASVAAGVLLAGGGGVYLATAASGDGGGADGATRSADAAGPPPSLRLGSDGGTDGGPGIAPGEPDPGGGPRGTVYKAKGPLPQGPSSAAVHRPEGLVTSAEVTRLADALGISGRPVLAGEVWSVKPEEDGSGPRLDVARRAPGNWTYSWYDGGPVGDTCLKGKACPPPGEVKPPSGGSPVSEAAAKAAAAPVLKAIGQDDAKVTAGQVMNGSVRVVNAEPVVGGLPTYGWSTGLHVEPDGRVSGGSGMLKEPAEGASYPVVGAAKALAELNEDSKGTGPIGIGGCATPVPNGERPGAGKPGTADVPGAGKPGTADVPGAGKPGTEEVPSAGKPGTEEVPGAGKPTGEAVPPCHAIADPAVPVEVPVTGAVFGLAARDVDGERLLVPAWLFTADPMDAAPHTVVRTAVEERYLAPPVTPPPSSGEGTAPSRQVQSYEAGDDGRKLTVAFWGGVCSTYEVTAEETPERVVLRIEESPADPDRMCVAMAVEIVKTVALDAPLGSRPVVDAASGEAVPGR